MPLHNCSSKPLYKLPHAIGVATDCSLGCIPVKGSDEDYMNTFLVGSFVEPADGQYTIKIIDEVFLRQFEHLQGQFTTPKLSTGS